VTSSALVQNVAPSRKRSLVPSALGSSGEPGTAKISRPASAANFAVIREPDRRAASTTTTARQRPATIRLRRVLPQGEMFPNVCLLPHHKCSRPTRVQPYTLRALPPKQAARDARFPLRRSERAACVPVAFYESAGSLMSRSSRCRPDSLGWLVDPRTRLWAAFRRRTFSRRCSVRWCPSR